LGAHQQSRQLTSTGLSPSTARLSNLLRLHRRFLTLHCHGSNSQTRPTTPHAQPLPGITCAWFGLIRFRSPLLSESQLFSLPVGTEMFHFPTFPPHTLCVQVQVTGHDSSWVSPFGHPRITARLPTPQGLSQAPTSFIGSWCQGIHHVPFIACLNNVKTTQLQKTSNPPHHHHPTPPTNKGKQGRPCARSHTYKSSPPVQSKPAATDARVHYPDLKQQPHQPPDPTNRRNQDKGENRSNHTNPAPNGASRPDPSGPNSVPPPDHPHPRPRFHTHTPPPHPKVRGQDTSSTEDQD
jgi:hypothetical protein